MLVRAMIIFHPEGSLICCRMYKIEEFVHPQFVFGICVFLLYKCPIIIGLGFVS